MRFRLKLYKTAGREIPINYQYPLSAAIYKILAKGDAEYASFLHEKGYGKGYKFFTFSDLKFKYKRENDRMLLLDPKVEFTVSFHLPEASRTFVEGLFKSENIVIADKNSKVVFQVQSIISLENPLKEFSPQELMEVIVKPTSAIVTGIKNERGHYDYLLPDDKEFLSSLIYGWRNKIRDAYDLETAEQAILSIELEYYQNPFRTRLVHIKSDSQAATKIRGSINYKLKLRAERRFIELLLNAGIGIESAQGMGSLEVVEVVNKNKKMEVK
ncbi:MAG TPA: CRISPR-associated endoribonuclease Cas6 [Chitinophagaceae bacterium]|nr:CRISPR-associated endoribonuclease Cas6 [Chitinophagaceae bacterium]